MIAAVSDEPLHVVEKKNMEKSQTELMISGSDLHYIMIKVPKDSSAFRNLLNNYGLSQLFYNFL
jgi:phage anti-repressor protein